MPFYKFNWGSKNNKDKYFKKGIMKTKINLKAYFSLI